jgi:hypothetical protein
MSWGTCNAGSNNIHFGFPPIMSDGRNYANWQPGAVINEQLRERENIQNNWDYRNYLQSNADSIMTFDRIQACDRCCTCPYNSGTQRSTPNQPFLYKSCVDSSQPYGYTNGDLKDIYLSRYQLECRMMTPYLTQQQLLKYANANT